MKTKLCFECRKRKPLVDFYRVHKGAWPRQKRCKACDNAQRVERINERKLAEGRPTALWRRLETLVRRMLRIDGDTTHVEREIRRTLRGLDRARR